ncbi:MAG: FAD-dependent oxidoreductase [Candidatus Spechtbacteria bacterium]|nr:FAD-dependent oxidoreductase [Candidatus Spechtbacteria bacterium]
MAENYFVVNLKARKEIAESTMEFRFEKPKGFEFIAGQHVLVTLINPKETDAEGNRRVFCLASAPYEEDLIVACRMRDTAFKREFGTMKIGSEVELRGPYGSMTLDKTQGKPAVFLAGGIGITPFRSIILDATARRLAGELSLFYSNYRPEDAAYISELRGIEKENKNYTFIPTMTEMKKSKMTWNGERGYISKEMLAKYVEDLKLPVYYITGPPLMVLSMQAVLLEMGVAPDSIETEQFIGY